MTRRRNEVLLWIAASAMAIVAVMRLNGLAPARIRAPGPDLGSTGEIRPSAGDSIGATARWLASVDPFRLARQPADVAYSPDLDGAPTPPVAPAPAKPALVVAGVVGGPPWEAVVEGLPGRDGGVVVREGDVFGDLRVRRVGPGAVVIQGVDTTWKLTVRRP